MDSMLSFMSDAKSSHRKRERPAEDEFGRSVRGPTLGHLHAVGGSSGSVEDYRDSKKAKVNFVPTRGEEDAPHRIREADRHLDASREDRGGDRGRYEERRDGRYDDRSSRRR